MDGVQSRYAEIPADISRRLEEVQLSLQREDEKVSGNSQCHMNYLPPKPLVFFLNVCCCVVILQLMEKSNPVRKLAGQVAELGSGLEKVKVLLEQKSPTVNDAQNALKVSVSLFIFACVSVCVNVHKPADVQKFKG